MNWITNVVRPGMGFFNKRETPENLWVKDPESGELVFHRDLEQNQFVVPNSGYHMKIEGRKRLNHFFDNADWKQIDTPDVAVDPLKFRDSKRYTDRLKEAKTKTGLKDAILIGHGKVNGIELVAAVQESEFMLGSLGMAAGEAIITAIMTAVKKKLPFVIFTASGGARMQEGIMSLMQMPRTTVAVQALRAAQLPYIVVLTNPTTGGVTASYAMLGDVHIAEPGALICFAGPRVIEQTIREKLPEGFQRSEYLKEHGMVDMVVHRHELPATIARICAILTHKSRTAPDKSAAAKVQGDQPDAPKMSAEKDKADTASPSNAARTEAPPAPPIDHAS
ncbi:MAG: acetyl-CoA carboxylase carboxyltransferase subunit beta [Rhizobiales bacterium]|nr:acetyl-CoA carboxylase carboxyltransferase subunit beta [Hyphomicrobiales bacterium]